MIKSQRIVKLLVGFLFLGGLSISPVLCSERVIAQATSEVGCPQCRRPQVPALSGIYRGVNIWGVLRITNFNYRVNPLTFSGDDNNENKYFRHFTQGTSISENSHQRIWKISTRRINTSNGCTTIMRGTLTQKRDDTIIASYTSSDGRCDLPEDFSAMVTLKKN